jgi:hypothetical protein
MDKVIEIASQCAFMAAIAGMGTMYLDAKHHIVKDIGVWCARRRLRMLVKEAFRRFGGYCTLYHLIEFNDPQAEAFWFEERCWTYREVRSEADKLAQWFQDQGLRTKGTLLSSILKLNYLDLVVVYMTNSPEAYFSAYALSKLGVTNAMVNSSLKGILPL